MITLPTIRSVDWGRTGISIPQLAHKTRKITMLGGFAFPSQSIYVETVPTDQAEIFVPPTTIAKSE